MSRNVLITGASSGIGEATARYLHSIGDTVIMVARNEEKLKALAEELGDNAYYYVYDFANLEDVENIFTFCVEKECKLDGLVHCAGISGHLPVKSMDMDILNKVMLVNTYSFVELGKFFCKKKYSTDTSSMVGISSYAAETMLRGTCIYSGSKALLNTYAKIMSKEFLKRKQRVNTIMPGYVETPMIAEKEIPDGVQPYGLIEPEQIAYMVEFLLSDKAKYITGATIPVTGGMEG